MDVTPDMADSMGPMLQSLNLTSSTDATGSFTFSPSHAHDGSGSSSGRNSATKSRGDRGSFSSANSDDSSTKVPRKPTITSLDPATASASYNAGNGEAAEGSSQSLGAGDSSVSGSASSLTDAAGQDPETVLDPEEIKTPIVGFETMEERARYTVFKIQVHKAEESWMVYKRFSDFTRLNQKLQRLYPGFRFALPPKRWFRSNFERDFLEERTLGLEAFLTNITGHSDICNSKPVREFFRFDHPPGPCESLEDSRALCETLEERLHESCMQLEEKEEKIKLLQEEVEVYRRQVEILTQRLREVASKELQSPSNRASLAECDQPSPPVSPNHPPSRDVSMDLTDKRLTGSQPLTSTPTGPASKTRTSGSSPRLAATSPIS